MKIKKFDEITVAELQSFGGVIVDGDSQKVYCRGVSPVSGVWHSSAGVA